MEDGACFKLWLINPLSVQDKSLLIAYQDYLQKYKMGYSFMFDLKVPNLCIYEKEQLLNTIGFIPEEEIYVCGLITPLLRSIEAILKYFGGYAEIGAGYDPSVEGVCYEIKRSLAITKNSKENIYRLSNWEIIANVYNKNDTDEIKAIYSIQRFTNHSKFLNYKDNQTIVDEDYKIMKSNIQRLLFICGVTIYWDPSATERRKSKGDINLCENNYSIVSDDGFFLMDKSRMLADRFYNCIEVNDYGLFKLSHKFSSDKSLGDLCIRTHYYDYEGNHISDYVFNNLITILSNSARAG